MSTKQFDFKRFTMLMDLMLCFIFIPTILGIIFNHLGTCPALSGSPFFDYWLYGDLGIMVIGFIGVTCYGLYLLLSAIIIEPLKNWLYHNEESFKKGEE